MKITGKYTVDQNFITVFSDNKIYTIARNSGDWGSLAVGDYAHSGGKLTQEIYDKWLSECEKEGSFTLDDN